MFVTCWRKMTKQKTQWQIKSLQMLFRYYVSNSQGSPTPVHSHQAGPFWSRHRTQRSAWTTPLTGMLGNHKSNIYYLKMIQITSWTQKICWVIVKWTHLFFMCRKVEGSGRRDQQEERYPSHSDGLKPGRSTEYSQFESLQPGTAKFIQLESGLLFRICE